MEIKKNINLFNCQDMREVKHGRMTTIDNFIPDLR